MLTRSGRSRGPRAVLLAALLAASAALGIGGALSANEKIVWGTFHEHDCEPKPRGGCRSIGTWTSDDGSIRKTDIYLDGFVDPGGAVRAAYRPHGFNNDDENNIVHVEALAYGWIWSPWLLMLFIIGIIAYYWRKGRPRPPVRRS